MRDGRQAGGQAHAVPGPAPLRPEGAAVRLSLESDLRGPMGAWMLRAMMAAADWVDVSEELTDLWDADHLAAVAADVAAEAEMYDEQADVAATDDLLPNAAGWADAFAPTFEPDYLPAA